MPANADAVHVYWRPGCLFCATLRRGLRRAGVATVDHDIWDDPAAADVVRRHTGGDETVPTVVVGDVAMVNPSTRRVVDHLVRVAPDLLPDAAGRSPRRVLGRLRR